MATATDSLAWLLVAGATDPATRNWQKARLETPPVHGTRNTGLSSDSMVAYYLTEEDSRLQEPYDDSDLAACENTYLLAPPAAKEMLAPVIERFREFVAERNRQRAEAEARYRQEAETRAAEQRAAIADTGEVTVMLNPQEYAFLTELVDSSAVTGELDLIEEVSIPIAGITGRTEAFAMLAQVQQRLRLAH